VSESRKKPIVIVIDIDDDIGSVTGRSLIIGEDDVKKVAVDFAIKRPEDADTNAIFAGINLYENLKSASREPEIAIIGGHPKSNMLAQMIIKDRAKQVVEEINEKEVELYLVSDGTDELLVAEVLRDIAPIAALKRVIVEQHLGVEGSYFLLARYVKKAIEDPKYSKYFLGVPGVLIALFGILSVFDFIYLALKVVLAVAGIFLVIKGFDLEDRTYNAFRGLARYAREINYFQIASLGVLLVSFFASIFAGYYSVVNKTQPLIIAGGITANTIPIIFLGFILYIVISKIFYGLTRSNTNIGGNVAQIVVLTSLAFSFYELGTKMIDMAPLLGTITGSDILAIFIDSGFILYVVLGTAVAVLIEAANYFYFKRDKKPKEG